MFVLVCVLDLSHFLFLRVCDYFTLDTAFGFPGWVSVLIFVLCASTRFILGFTWDDALIARLLDLSRYDLMLCDLRGLPWVNFLV